MDLTLAVGAEAATVAVGGTGSTGAGGFTFADGSATTDWVGQPGVWTTAPMIEDAVWVQVGPEVSSVFEFGFDLTGFDLNTVSLIIDWAVDNAGSVDLNGSEIGTIPFGASSAYDTISTVTVTNPSSFLAGQNTLSFTQFGDQSTDGFRAAVRVTADLAPVPLPAGGLLLITAFGGLGFAAHRRRKAA